MTFSLGQTPRHPLCRSDHQHVSEQTFLGREFRIMTPQRLVLHQGTLRPREGKEKAHLEWTGGVSSLLPQEGVSTGLGSITHLSAHPSTHHPAFQRRGLRSQCPECPVSAPPLQGLLPAQRRDLGFPPKHPPGLHICRVAAEACEDRVACRTACKSGRRVPGLRADRLRLCECHSSPLWKAGFAWLMLHRAFSNLHWIPSSPPLPPTF